MSQFVTLMIVQSSGILSWIFPPYKLHFVLWDLQRCKGETAEARSYAQVGCHKKYVNLGDPRVHWSLLMIRRSVFVGC